MTLVRFQGVDKQVVADLLGGARPIDVGGERVEVIRLTVTKEEGVGISEDLNPQRMHEAGKQAIRLRKSSGSPYVAEAQKCDREGKPKGERSRYVVLAPWNGSRWGKGEQDRLCHVHTVGCSRTEVQIWTPRRANDAERNVRMPACIPDDTAEAALAEIKTPASQDAWETVKKSGKNLAGQCNLEERVEPGAALVFAIAAGGKIEVQGPGESAAIQTHEAAWIRIFLPEDFGEKAAKSNLAETINVRGYGTTGSYWMLHEGFSIANSRSTHNTEHDFGDACEEEDPGMPCDPPDDSIDAFLRHNLAKAEERAQSEGDAALSTPEAGHAAAELLRTFGIEEQHNAVIGKFAAFLEEHIRLHLKKARSTATALLSWQWSLLTLIWILQEAGITAIARDPSQNDEYARIIGKLGLSADTRRHAQPFGNWEKGAAPFKPGGTVPGMFSQKWESLGRTYKAVSDETAQLLAGLVMQVQDEKSNAGEGSGSQQDSQRSGGAEASQGTNGTRDSARTGRPEATSRSRSGGGRRKNRHQKEEPSSRSRGARADSPPAETASSPGCSPNASSAVCSPDRAAGGSNSAADEAGGRAAEASSARVLNTTGAPLLPLNGYGGPTQAYDLFGLNNALRGHAGGGQNEGRAENCVIDALCQIVLDNPRAGHSEEGAAKVREIAGLVRQLTGGGAGTKIEAADAWAVIMYSLHHVTERVPRLIQIALEDSKTGLYDENLVETIGTAHPWDGTFCCLATTKPGLGVDEHTVPVWFDGKRPRTAVEMSDMLPRVSTCNNLSTAVTTALSFGLKVEYQAAKGEGHTPAFLRQQSQARRVVLREGTPPLPDHMLWCEQHMFAECVSEATPVQCGMILVHGELPTIISASQGADAFSHMGLQQFRSDLDEMIAVCHGTSFVWCRAPNGETSGFGIAAGGGRTVC